MGLPESSLPATPPPCAPRREAAASRRRSGELLRKSELFVPQMNLFARPSTGSIVIAPGAFGGASWSPVAYSAQSSLAYVAAVHLPMKYSAVSSHSADGAPVEYTEAIPDDASTRWGRSARSTRRPDRSAGSRKPRSRSWAACSARAGGLAFTGEGSGRFDAFDADSGQELWSYTCDAGVNAPPITYRVGTTQYVAVAAGGNALFGYRSGDSLIAFALPNSP